MEEVCLRCLGFLALPAASVRPGRSELPPKKRLTTCIPVTRPAPTAPSSSWAKQSGSIDGQSGPRHRDRRRRRPRHRLPFNQPSRGREP